MNDTHRRVPARPAQTSRSRLAKSVDAGLVPLIASLAPWGVGEGHWLPGRDTSPVIWLRTHTKVSERARLETQSWLLPQVQAMLSQLGVPYQTVCSLTAEITSVEDEESLFLP